MLSRFVRYGNISFISQLSGRLASSRATNYICDAVVIGAYQTNQKLKSIIDRQEHQFFYFDDDKTRQQNTVPAVFKPLPANSNAPENARYLVSSPAKNTADHAAKQMSIADFVELTVYNDHSKGSFPGLLGIEFLSMTHGYSFGQVEVREELLAPNGYLHAGVVITLADTACGYGCMKSKPVGAKSFTTIELKSNFLGTAKPSALIQCEARLVHGGKTTQIWDAEVKNAQTNKLIAIFRCTQLIIY